MSSNPNSNRGGKSSQQSNSAIVATIAAVGLGAVAAVGAYFMGRSAGEEEAARRNAPHHDMGAWGGENEQKKPGGGDEKDGETVEECSICSRGYEELKGLNEEIHTTPCGHVFCAKCINTWLGIKEECPKCKRPVGRGQTLRIYL
jgi:hypothetical protein